MRKQARPARKRHHNQVVWGPALLRRAAGFTGWRDDKRHRLRGSSRLGRCAAADEQRVAPSCEHRNRPPESPLRQRPQSHLSCASPPAKTRHYEQERQAEGYGSMARRTAPGVMRVVQSYRRISSGARETTGAAAHGCQRAQYGVYVHIHASWQTIRRQANKSGESRLSSDSDDCAKAQSCSALWR